MTMFAILAALASPALDAQPAAEPQPIVVTGARLRDLRTNLEACLRRNCPPNEDIDASLALAEGEFLNGEYERSVRWIEASIGRNRRYRRAFPEPVADLRRAQARVRAHMGHDQIALFASREILGALRAGIPAEDHRHFTARFEIAQMLLQMGNVTAARTRLRELIALAEQAGRDDVVRRARMRLLQLAYWAQPRGEHERTLLQLAHSADPAQRFESLSARLILARQYRRNGDTARADEMLAGFPPSEGDTRALRYSPPINLIAALARGARDPVTGRSSTLDNFEDKWIDVVHWIRPDGTVEDVEIVRQGGSAGWAQPVLASIRGRLYEASSDPASSYRLERYTYTATLGLTTGSRIATRTGAPRVEFLDLTSRDEPGRETPTAVPPGS